MNILERHQFLGKKQHDGICILGTGYSINNITPEQWLEIENNYDTFGMNWFLKSTRLVTWYLVREQCASKKRIEPDHTLDDFIVLMKHQKYSCKIVKDMSYQANNYIHAKNTDKFEGDGFIFKEIQGGCSAKSFKISDIFIDGIHHGKGTIYDALHFAIGMDYKKILFGGIDLYDNRYFYLPYDDTLQLVKNEGRDQNSQHLMATKTIDIIQQTKEHYNLEMAVINPHSLLNQILPIWGE